VNVISDLAIRVMQNEIERRQFIEAPRKRCGESRTGIAGAEVTCQLRNTDTDIIPEEEVSGAEKGMIVRQF
jgi:hypothetical protein